MISINDNIYLITSNLIIYPLKLNKQTKQQQKIINIVAEFYFFLHGTGSKIETKYNNNKSYVSWKSGKSTHMQ